MLKSICPTCGAAWEPTDSTAECKSCRPRDTGDKDKYLRGNRHQRGYGYRWEKLSKRARELQPFCSDCGRTDTLTGDHSTEAWKRHDAGLPIRLKDIDVVCRQCNTDRGAARGIDATDKYRVNGNTVEVVAEWITTDKDETEQ